MPHCRFVAIIVLVVSTNFQMPNTSTTDDFTRTSVEVGTVTSEVRVEPSASVTLTSVQVDGLLNEMFVYPTPAGGETKTLAVQVVSELFVTEKVVPIPRASFRVCCVLVTFMDVAVSSVTTGMDVAVYATETVLGPVQVPDVAYFSGRVLGVT